MSTKDASPDPPKKQKKPPKKVAEKKRTVGKPRSWEKAVLAAYFRLRGFPQEEAATSAGIGARTMERWVQSDWWQDALDDARARWYGGIEIDARITLGKAMKAEDQPDLALKLLERMDHRLAPPRQQIELLTDYMHKDEVLKIFRRFAEGVADIVDDPDMRKAIIELAQETISPILTHATPQE